MDLLDDRPRSCDRNQARGLRAFAYRMLGSRTEAEDIVQEAWSRRVEVDDTRAEQADASLSRLVTRLCLDRLHSAAHRREQYVGVWLPEPLLNEDAGFWPDPHGQAEFAQDVSIALLLALERLSPLERAAFLLHDIFDLDFDEIAGRLGCSPVACRQLSSRARRNVEATYARREVTDEECAGLFAAFSDAVRRHDVDALADVLASDALMLADDGGKASAVPRPLRGAALVARALIGFVSLPSSRHWRLEGARVNGLPGGLVFDDADGRLVQTIALEPSASESCRIGAIYIQRNPDKLRGLSAVGPVTQHGAGTS